MLRWRNIERSKGQAQAKEPSSLNQASHAECQARIAASLAFSQMLHRCALLMNSKLSVNGLEPYCCPLVGRQLIESWGRKTWGAMKYCLSQHSTLAHTHD